MSELQRQLDSLRNQHIQNISLYSGTPSLFFSSKEAGLIDIDEVFDAAVDGLRVLSQYEPRFQLYLENLLHPSSKSLQRELQTTEERRILDSKLEDLFELLSLYASESNCHKILEFLIRRYRVQELNTDSLILSMLSQHDTKIFARVMQLTSISGSVWAFLEPYKSSGATLPRVVLAKRCSKDHILLSKLSSLVLSAISLAIADDPITLSSSLRISNQISFFTAVILEMVDETKLISDQQLRTIFPYIIGGISHQFPLARIDSTVKVPASVAESWQHSCCMIVSQISRYVELSKPLLQTLINSVAKGIRAKLDPESTGFISQEKGYLDDELQSSIENILMAVTVVMQYQKVKLSAVILRELFVDRFPPYSICDIVLQCLNGIRLRHDIDISPVLDGMIDGIAASLFAPPFDDDESFWENPIFFLEIYRNIISTFEVDTMVLMSSTELLLDNLIAFPLNIPELKERDQNLLGIVSKIFRLLSQRHPLEFDTTINNFVIKLGDTKDKSKAIFVLNSVFEHFYQSANDDNSLSLLISLHHSSKFIKRDAILHFGKTLFGSDVLSCKSGDHVYALASAILNILDVNRNDLDIIGAIFRIDVLVPVFQILHDRVDVIVEQFISISPSLRNQMDKINLLNSLYSAQVLKEIHVLSDSKLKHQIFNKLFLLLLFLILPLRQQDGPFNAVNGAIQHFAQYHPLLTGENFSYLSDSSDFLHLIAKIISGNLIVQPKMFISQVHEVFLIYCHYYSHVSQSKDWFQNFYEVSSICFLDLMFLVGEELQLVDHSRETPIILFSISLSWILYHFHHYSISSLSHLSDHFYRRLSEILLQYCKTWKNVASPHVSQLHSDYRFGGSIKSLVSSNLSAKLLVTGLDLIHTPIFEGGVNIATLLKTCLDNFFPNRLIPILTSVCSIDTSIEVSDELPTSSLTHFLLCPEGYQDLFDNREICPTRTDVRQIIVSQNTQISALYTLSGYVRQASSLSSSDLTSLLPIVLSFLLKENLELQQAAFGLFQVLTKSLDSKKYVSEGVPMVNLRNYFTDVGKKINILQCDSKGMLTVLQSQLTPYDDVVSFFIGIIRNLSWNFPVITSSLLKIFSSDQSLDILWNGCCKTLFNDALTNSSLTFSTRELCRTLVSICSDQSKFKVKPLSTTNLIENYQQFLTNRSTNTLAAHIREEILLSLSKQQSTEISPSENAKSDVNWVEKLDSPERELLFESLISQIDRNSNEDFLTPLCSIQVSPQICLKYLLETFESLKNIFEKFGIYSETVNYSFLEISGNQESQLHHLSEPLSRKQSKLITNSLTMPLQKISWTLEALNSSFNTKNFLSDKSDSIGRCSCVLFDLLDLLNTKQINKILSVCYTRNILLEMLCTSMKTINLSRDLSDEPFQKPASSKPPSQVIIGNRYSSNRIQHDISVIFKCLELSSTIYIHKSSLELLHVLLTSCPSQIHQTITLLTRILSTNILSENISYENTNNLVSNILKTIIQIMNQHQFSESQQLSPQDILQPYFHTFQMISSRRRSSLLNIITEQYDATVIPICISLILTHVLISYSGIPNSLPSENGESDEKKETFVLLSRSASRKMNRMIRTSQSEEFFHLALSLNLQLEPALQINSLISMTQIVKKLLGQCLGPNTEGDLVPIEFIGSHKLNQYQFSSQSYINYTNSFHHSNPKQPQHSNTPALIILQLEYLLEFLECPQFHDHLLTLLFNSQNGMLTSFGHNIQQLFLSFSEALLELLSYLTSLQHISSSKKNLQTFSMQLNQQKITVSSKELLKYISTLCLNILHSLQNLLDGPTFIVILQELLSHENLSVRQKSLEILSDRLRSLERNRAKIDEGLYLELAMKLRLSVLGCHEARSDNDVVAKQTIGVAQSALLCIDILSRQFLKNKEWIKPMSEFLADFVKLSDRLSQLLCSSDLHQEEEVKLLGSTFLCCGTLSTISKTKSLPYLATLIGRMLDVIETSGAFLRSHSAAANSKAETSSLRTRVLLIRSCLSTLATITTDLSAFFHPYIPRSLQTIIPFLSKNHMYPDFSSLTHDINDYLQILIKCIPKRLCIPALVQVTPILYGMGHEVAYHFAIFLRNLWSSLERNDVTTYLLSLQTICQSGFEYRELYEGRGDDLVDVDVDEAICESVIEICLKYTENELKEYLLHLHQWSEFNISLENVVNDERNEWLKYCRCHVFFHFISQLEAKLQGIFVPLMGLVWVYGSEQMSKFLQFVHHNQSEFSHKTKKRKRRDTELGENTLQIGDSQLVKKELHETSVWILDSVRLCCIHDEIHFIDQIQYEVMMPVVSSLLSIREYFESDETYAEYALETVLPSVVQLVIAVGKDVLWKPLNHKILQMTRSKKKIVRIVALKSLQRLFSEVGEEYLLLLPECLSYLSELLEDDSSEVTTLTSEVIQNIEELSGESLDSYLR